MSYYELQTHKKGYTLNIIDPTTHTDNQKTGELRKFLSAFSAKLDNPNAFIKFTNSYKNETPNYIHTFSYAKHAVNEIQQKVCRGVLFWILSWIPYTSARETSLLFKQVQDKIEKNLTKYRENNHPGTLLGIGCPKIENSDSSITEKKLCYIGPLNMEYDLNSYTRLKVALVAIKRRLDANTEFTKDNFKEGKINPEDKVFEIEGYKLTISTAKDSSINLEYSISVENVKEISVVKKNELLLMAFRWLLSETNKTQKVEEEGINVEEYFNKYLALKKERS